MDRIGNVVPGILNSQMEKLMQKSGTHLISVLEGVWPLVVGGPVADRTRPMAFWKGTLTLEVNCPTWNLQLHKVMKEIRAAVNSFLGRQTVERIRFRYRPSPGGEPANEPSLEPGNEPGNKDDTGKFQGAATVRSKPSGPPNAPPPSRGPAADSDSDSCLGMELQDVFQKSRAKYFARSQGEDR